MQCPLKVRNQEGKRIHVSYYVFVKNSPNRFRITSTSISFALKQHCQETNKKVLTFLDEFCLGKISLHLDVLIFYC